MKIAVECSESTIFNWCEGVVVNMKGQLTREKEGKLKKFGYGTILISFSLERIPLLIPQQITVDEIGLRDPHMLQWVSLMACHGGDGGPIVRYTTQVLCVAKNPYFHD